MPAASAKKVKKVLRNDPKIHHSGGASRFRILNEDQFPHLHLKWVDPTQPERGIEFHKELGYELMPKTDDGPRCAIGRTVKNGDPITCSGQYLMACPIERYRELEQHGDGFGALGQDYADEIDRILGKRGTLRLIEHDSSFQAIDDDDEVRVAKG